MNCNSSVEHNKEIIKDLLKLDPVKYKNFDRVAEFILDAPIDNENKSVSLHVISNIFIALAEYNPSFESGKAAEVAGLSELLIDIPAHVQAATSILKPSKKIVNTYQKLIDDLDDVLNSDLSNEPKSFYANNVLKPIRDFFNNYKFVSPDEKKQKIQEVFTYLNKIKDVSPFSLYLEDSFEELSNELYNVNIFKSLQDIKDDNVDLDTYIVTLQSREVVEAVKDDQGFMTNKLTGLPIDEADIVAQKLALYQRESERNDDKISHTFYNNDLVSGLRIKPYSTTESFDDTVNAFADIVNPENEVKIYAVKIDDFADNRVAEIQRIEGLENRNHETFESEAQVEYLKENADNAVIAITREKKSEEVFTLVAEIVKADGSTYNFYIYGLNNFAVLRGDNTTSKLDFTSVDDLQTIQDLAVFRNENGKIKDLTEHHLLTLKKHAENFNVLKNQIVKKLNGNAKTNVLDVTKEFFKSYSFEKDFKIKKFEPLNEALKNNSNAFHDVQVKTYDEKGNVVSEESIKIPFLFVKPFSNAVDYKPVNFLKKNQKIVYNDEELDLIDYLEKLGLDGDFVSSLLDSKNQKYANSIFLIKNKEGKYTYRIGKYREHIDNEVLFSKFVADLNLYLTGDVQKNFESFYEKYTIRPIKNKNAESSLALDFTVSLSDQLQIKIGTFKNSKDFADLKKNDFYFKIPNKSIRELLKSFLPSSREYAYLQQQFSFLKDVQLYDEDNNVNFKNVPVVVDKIFNNALAGKDPIIKEMFDNIEKAKIQFNNLIKTNVIDVINNPKNNEEYGEFIKQVNEDFGSLDNLFFNHYDDQFKTPFVKFGELSVNEVNEDLTVSFNNYGLVNSTTKKLIITPKKAGNVAPTSSVVTVSKPVRNKINTKVDKTILETTVTERNNEPTLEAPETSVVIEEAEEPENFDDEAPFSVLEQGERQLATEQEILTEDKWLADTYATELGVEYSLDGIKDIIELTKLEGSVLGAVKNRVIYLDSNMRVKGVLYHEAFHGVFRFIMDGPQRRALLDSVINNKKYAALFTDAAITNFAEDRNYTYEKSKLIDLIAEEVLADGFQAYMNKKQAPKTMLQQFFEFLKRIIAFFKRHSNDIDLAYEKIRKGEMRAAVKEENLFNNEIAFDNITGLLKNTVDQRTGNVKQVATQLESLQNNELIDSVVEQLFKIDIANEDASFEDKFNEATISLLENTWNYDLLKAQISEDDTEKQALLKKLFYNKFSQYRFILGARMRGVVVYDLNDTTNPGLDKKIYKNKYRRNANEAVKDNTNGSESYEQLKKAVKEKYDHVKNILNYEEDLDDNEEKELNLLKESEKNLYENPQNEHEDEQDDAVSNPYEDKSLAEKGGIQSLPKELREMMSILKYEIVHPELGIKIPKYVDAYETFGVLLKISSNVDYDNILENIKVVSNMLLDDNLKKNYDAANDLLKVYEYIKEKSQIVTDENGTIKVSNSRFYNIFLDTVKKAAVDYIVIEPRFRTFTPSMDDDIVDDSSYVQKKKSSMVDFDVRDKILFTDVNATKNKIIKNITATYSKNKNTPEYINALKKINKYIGIIAHKDNKSLFSSAVDESVKIEKYSKELSDAFQEIGMDFSKSLIRLSLLAIDIQANKNLPMLNTNGDFYKHYLNNEHFILENKYLELDFFKDLQLLINKLYAKEITSSELSAELDDNNGEFSRLSLIIRNAASYLTTYDPTELPSVYRNAEGKPVYRYLPYTPVLHIAEDVRKFGVVKSLQNDEFFENSKDFYSANPFFKPLMNNEDTEEARRLRLFYKNFTVSLYGGVNQSVDDGKKDGNVFKNIDDASQYVLYMLGFLKRNTHSARVNGQITNIVTFTRMFTTIEATNTNYLMPALYDSYVNKDGTFVTNENGVEKHVDMLLQKVRQEFERIKSETTAVTKLKKAFDADKRTGERKLVNKYNAVLNDDNSANVTDDELRAFKFNYFTQMFNNNPELKNALISHAKSKKNFDSLPEQTLQSLIQALREYSDKKLQDHFKNLVRKDIITPSIVKNQNEEGKVITTTKYTSKLLPKIVKESNNKKLKIAKEYGKSSITDYKNVVTDAFYNYWVNSLFVNEVFDGDIALGVKNAVDYNKRQKRNAASNSNLKKGTHKVAYIDTLSGYIHPEYLGFGPYASLEEVEDDPRLKIKKNQTIREHLIRDYGKKVIFNGVETDTMHKLFDGQSVSVLMHHMDMYETIGRLNPKIKDLIIKKHYSPLSAAELTYLKKNKVVLNSKKTVTASRSIYHKLSEMYIDRNDVSMFAIPLNDSPENAQYANLNKKTAYKFLHEQYSKIYNLRIENQARIKQNDFSLNDATEAEIKTIFKEIHKFYQPLPHRVKLHEMLNSMEYHNIDQLMDTESSKLATLLPTNVNNKDANGYIKLQRSSIDAPNRFKFWQVETSGIKTIIKYSVQSKVLIPANLPDVTEIIKKKGVSLTAAQQDAIKDEMNNLLFDYHSTLKDVAISHESLMQLFLKDEGDARLNIGFMFDLIRKNLAEQNVSSNKLRLFETDPQTGLPIHNANLSEIRDMLKYYFFSQYSKFTDEKGTGEKFIHMTAYGHEILVDSKGNTIFTEDYKKNPSAYGKVKSRPLGISIEKRNGKTVYFVECIVPKPLYNNPEKLEKYKEKILKMFATRIPTEDKRSMVILKVVDYIDSANMTGIIVPQLVHILAGSDLDIDTLYTQQYSFYRNFNGKEFLYGDYSGYNNEKEGKFIEYLNYVAKDKDFTTIIKRNLENIKTGSKIIDSPLVRKVLELSGVKTEDLNQAFETFKNNNLDTIDIDEVIAELEMLKKTAKTISNDDAYVYKNDVVPSVLATLLAEKGLVDKIENSIQTDAVLGRTVDKARLDELAKISKDYFKKVNQLKFIAAYMKVQSILQTLQEQRLPTSITNFQKNPIAELIVKNKYQNANLDAKINILSNEYVFNNLYINERSSTQAFLKILKDFGIDLDAENAEIDQFTIDGVVSSRLKNVLSKAGIGTTANINKTLAFLSQYRDELFRIVKDPVFRFVSGETGEYNIYGDIGGFNIDDERIIGIIGNILGMFADGAKEPIPAALNLNEVNTPVTLAMIAVGIKTPLAIAFNFIPEIKTAIENVQKSTYAVNDGLQNSRKYLVNELGNMIRDLQHERKVDKDYKIINELKDAGLISQKGNINNMEGLGGPNLVIAFNQKKLDKESLLDNTLTLDELGIRVSAIKTLESIDENEEVVKATTEVQLSEKAQKLILLHLYKEQAKQNGTITSAGNIVNMFKRLRPDFEFLDKMLKDVKELKNGNSLVPGEIADKIFSDDQVFNVIDRILQHIDRKSQIMFIERSEHFKHIRNTFENLFKSKDLFAKTITSYIALNKYKQAFSQNDPSYSQLTDEQKAKKDEETAMILEMFNADYWFDNDLESELSEMQEKHPENAFLNRLRTFTTSNEAIIKAENEEDNKFVNEKIITLLGTAKLTGRLLENVENDAHNLFKQEPMFFKRLFIHEIIRTGLMQKSGSYMPYLNPDFKLGISKHLNDFEDILKTINNPSELISKLKSYFNYTSDEELYTFFETMLYNLVYQSSDEIDNNRIRTIASSKRPINVDRVNGFSKIDTSDLNDPDADPVDELIDYILPIPGVAQFDGEELYLTDDIFDYKTEQNKKAEDVIFNFNIPNKSYGNITQNNMIDIAKSFDIAYDSNTKMFVFPSAIIIGESYYVLKGTDTHINRPLGFNLLSSEKYESAKEEFITTYNTGTLALYKRLPNKPIGSSISALAFNSDQLKRYADLTASEPTQFLNIPGPKKSKKEVRYSLDAIINKTSQNKDALQYNVIYPTNDKAELLEKLNELQKLHNEGVALYTMRVSKKQAKHFKGLDEQHHYGNPFTGTNKKDQIPMNGITAAVNAYEQWLDGQDEFIDKNGVAHDLSQEEDSQGVEYSERRDWINSRIEKLSQKPEIIKLGYFLKGYRSHADILDERMNKGKRDTTQSAEVEEVTKSDLSYEDTSKKEPTQLQLELELDDTPADFDDDTGMIFKSKYLRKNKNQDNLPEIPDTTDC
jgi:hypothetical protein